MKKIHTCLFAIALVIVTAGCSDDDNSPSNSVKITKMDPSSPATLQFGDFVVITTTYHISNKDGARMWVQPYTDGDITPNYLYSSSSVYSGSGTREVGISVDDGDGDVHVDQLRVIMTDPDQTEDLQEFFVSVDFTFSE